MTKFLRGRWTMAVREETASDHRRTLSLIRAETCFTRFPFLFVNFLVVNHGPISVHEHQDITPRRAGKRGYHEAKPSFALTFGAARGVVIANPNHPTTFNPNPSTIILHDTETSLMCLLDRRQYANVQQRQKVNEGRLVLRRK
jgi:hypothetical protein